MNRQGFDRYDELFAWSCDHRDAFWQTVIDDIDILFEVSPSAVRGSSDPTQPEWLPDALFNVVASCLDHGDEATAIVHGSAEGLESVSVGELRGRVGAFAEGLKRLGVQPGDRVAIAMPMNDYAVVAYLGIVAAGAVVVSIADSFAPSEIAVRFSITEPVAVVTQDVSQRLGKVLPMYAKVVDADGPQAIVVRTEAESNLRSGDMWWNDFVVQGARFQPVSQPASAPTNILFSSGTTGEPKAIPWTQTTPIKAAMDGRYHQDIHAGDVVAWPTNLGWMMGPWLIYAALLNGAAIALYDDAPTDAGFVSFVDAAGVMMLGLVPSIVKAWRAADLLPESAWPAVRVLSSTGEASNADDYGWLMRRVGSPVIEYCGGTEIGGGYLSGTVVQPAVPSRFTTPTLGLDLRILDEEGSPSDVGEVFLVPPSIGLSTELLNRDHTAVYFDGVPQLDVPLRRHGDQLRRWPDGTYQALGRVDDTMNLGGIKVSSADLEAAIGGVPGVKEVAAVAVPPPGGGPDRLVVFVVASPDAPQSVDELTQLMQQAIRSDLNPLFRIHEVVMTEALPRTASQKVMRRSLRSEYTR